MSRSFSPAITPAVARSKRACASRVSVMVAVPTSKFRFADASCSAMAVLPACAADNVSCAAKTSKYACATRTIKSCSAVSRSLCAAS